MRRGFIAMILIVFAVVIFLPPIIHGYVYPVIGQDTATHEVVFDKIKIGEPIPSFRGAGTNIRYFGYYIVGYPLDLVSQLTSVSKDVLFFWFNYIALLGVGLSLFYIFNRLLGIYAGILSLVIPIFTSYGVLLLYYSGVLFNLINIGVVLPFICMFTIEALLKHKKRYWIWAGILSVLFVVFHSTGIYLPFIILAGLLGVAVYKIVKRQSSEGYFVVSGAVLAGIFIFLAWNPLSISFKNDGFYGFPLLQRTLFYYMSGMVAGIIAISVAYLYSKKLAQNEKAVISVFGLSAVTLLPSILFGWSQQPFRQGLDFSILMAMLAVGLMAVVIRLDNKHYVVTALMVLVVVGSAININGWFKYNSALEKVDIEAINYINSLPINSYDVSHNIDQVIYGRFLHKRYLRKGADIVILRNEAMKSRGVLPEIDISVEPRKEIQEFSDGKITIEIYK